MNFSYLHSVISEMQYDEIKIIGKTVGTEEKPCHIAALLRQGDQGKICMFMKENSPLTWERKIMRSNLREQALRMETRNMKLLRVDDLILEVGGGTGYYLQNCGPDGMVLIFQLMKAGWQMPEDGVFYEMDWEKLLLDVYEFRGSLSQLPDIDCRDVSITWMPECQNYLIEKPVRLAIGDAQKGTTGEQELAFSIPGADGGQQEGICYINWVGLVDVWKEMEVRYADPEFQKRALEHITAEQFEETKKQTFQILEQICPRGMCYVQIEYENTLDVSLDFYSQDYLDSVPKASKGSASFILVNHKPGREIGDHGLKMRAGEIQVPVPPDTREIRAELFLARRMIPEREETL